MIGNISLPHELNAAVGSESKDFAVKAERAKPLKNSLAFIIFGIVWTGIASAMALILTFPLLQGKEVRFELNGIPTVASPDNLRALFIPALLIGGFILVGICVILGGIYSMFRKGGYFVGTPSRLVHYKNGNMRSIDWEQFSGDIEVGGTAQKGDISLQMRTGKLVKRKNGPERFVPDFMYIAGIPNAFEIEQICRKRIKENDPTPARTGN